MSFSPVEKNNEESFSSDHSESTILYYIHDPMCSWCYAFSRTWLRLKSQLPSGLTIKYLVGGLAPDSDEPMSEEMKSYLIQTWQRIENNVPGTQFNYAYWKKNKPRRSTYPACRAVLLVDEEQQEAMIDAIQTAYYQQAKNPSDTETLVNAAQHIGLDGEGFAETLVSEQTQYRLEEDIRRVRDLGVNSFPSLVLVHQQKRHHIKINYTQSEPMLQLIEEIIKE